MKNTKILLVLCILLVALGVEMPASAQSGGTTEWISVTIDGTQGNGSSEDPSISADGRFVAFSSDASHLVPGDTNGLYDIFVHDSKNGTTELISITNDGIRGDYYSTDPSISADGRFVAFSSRATQLVPGDTNDSGDVFVYDRQNKTIELISLSTEGEQGYCNSDSPSISADGRYVAFVSWSYNLVYDPFNDEDQHCTDDDYDRFIMGKSIFLRDRQNGTTELISYAANGERTDWSSLNPSISADGRYVAFESYARNLVSGDTNERRDVFVRDRQTGKTERVSKSTSGIQGNSSSTNPSISADGRYVAFESDASNLVPGDVNMVSEDGGLDVFVRDRQNGTTELISLASDGTQGEGWSSGASISADGRLVAFESTVTNLVAGDTNEETDVFVRDRQNGTTERVSVAGDGAPGNGYSYNSSISANGECVAFRSGASNLVAGNTGGHQHIFAHYLGDSSFIYSISGQVTDSSGNPFSGVTISDGAGHQAVSNSDGSYILDDQESGTYTLTPSKDGYSFTPSSTQTKIVYTNKTDINFSGSFIGYSITGKVADSSGRSTSGVIISDGAGHETTTGSDGSYTFSGLTPETYTLTPSKPGYSFTPPSTEVVISANNKTAMNFTGFTSMYSISGTVTDPDGGPMSGATISDGWGFTTITDSDGGYTFTGLAPETYTLTPTMLRYHFTPSSTQVVITNDHITAVNFAGSHNTYFIAGKVMDSDGNPISGTTISVGGGHQVVSTSDGSYTLSGLKAGTYKLIPSKDGYSFTPSSMLLTVADSNIFAKDFYGILRGVGITELISLASDGTLENAYSSYASASADGRFVAFDSYASNLVAGDTNGTPDIFVRDRLSGTTERVSVNNDGIQGNSSSTNPSISADGRYVAFDSRASNLVSGDTNELIDVFVRDRLSGTTEQISVANDGVHGNFSSDVPSISADGRFVAFGSYASNLVPGDTNGHDDIFVRDRKNGTTELVSVASDGTQGEGWSSNPSISADGRFVAFISDASNLVAGDTNGYDDVFVRDRLSGTTERVSVDNDGIQGNYDSYSSSISADGRYVAFDSYASNLVPGDTNGVSEWSGADVFIRDRLSGTTERVSINNDGIQGNSSSYASSISADGRFVAFTSNASNLVAGDTDGVYDVFVRDRQSGMTEIASVASDGTQIEGWSSSPSVSADGRFIAFRGDTNKLLPGGTVLFDNIFIRDRGAYSIFGKVVDSAGNPIPNVAISYGWGYQTVTDSDGSYALSDLVTGTYVLTPSIAGYTFTPPSTQLVLGGLDITDINFTGSFSGYLSGSVTNSAGSPISGVTVSAGTGHEVITDENGNYIFNGLTAGTYTLTPSKDGYSFTPASTQVVITNANKTAINFTGTIGGYSISGKVLDSGGSVISGVTISDGVGHQVTTISDGSYTLGGLAVGNYTLTPSKDDYSFTPASTQVVITNANKADVNFTGLKITYSISGKVTDSSGSPIPDVTVSDGAGHQATSASDGSYTVSGLAAGTYTLSPSKTGYNFTPPSAKITVVNADLTGVDFTARVNSSPSDLYNLYIPVLQQ